MPRLKNVRAATKNTVCGQKKVRKALQSTGLVVSNDGHGGWDSEEVIIYDDDNDTITCIISYSPDWGSAARAYQESTFIGTVTVQEGNLVLL